MYTAIFFSKTVSLSVGYDKESIIIFYEHNKSANMRAFTNEQRP